MRAAHTAVSMVQVTPEVRVLVAVEAADFRRGIDGLAQLCRASLAADPFSGAVFVFRNRRRTAVKLLVYDGQGYWLAHKRLDRGVFKLPQPLDEGAKTVDIDERVLDDLLGGSEVEPRPPRLAVH